MIGFLQGVVIGREEDRILLNCHGVGYELHVSREVLNTLSDPGDEGSCFVYTLVREDEISLYGFASQEEKALFLLLHGVSGVGPKTALSILSGMGSEGFLQAVLSGNPLPFTQVKGIGKRIAERIVLELKDKTGKLFSGSISLTSSGRTAPSHGRRREVQDALLGLGYRIVEITKALDSLPPGDHATVEDEIREALKRLR